MSWTLNRFETSAGVAYLPAHAPEEEVDTGDAPGSYMALQSGGVMDSMWGEATWPTNVSISRRGLYISNGTSAHDQLLALMKHHGLTGKLYRRHVVTGVEHWTHARLRKVSTPFTPANVMHLSVDTQFDRVSRSWFGQQHGFGLAAAYETATFDSLFSFEDDAEKHALVGSGTTGFQVQNGGNTDVANAVLTFDPGDAAITALALYLGRARWTWAGNLPASGQVLRIDTGARSVTRRTTLTSVGAIGATTLAVAESYGILPGDIIQVGLDSSRYAVRTVNTVPNSTTITITVGLPEVASVGREVVGGAYSGFALDTSIHSISDWLRIPPGESTVFVDLTGGGTGSTVLFDYYEAWK